MSPHVGHKPEAAGCKITKDDTNIVFCSIICSLAYGLYGSCYTALAAAIPQLSEVLDVDSSDFGMAYTTRGIGYLIGTLLSAYLLKIEGLTLTKTFLACVSLIFIAVTVFVMAFGKSYAVVLAIFSVQGLGFGGIDMMTNCALPELWGSRAQPWMQGMHTMFGIGSIVGPFMVGYIGYKAAFIIIAFACLAPLGLYFLGLIATSSQQSQKRKHQRLSSNEETAANTIEMTSVHGGSSAVLTLSDEDPDQEIRFDYEESSTANKKIEETPKNTIPLTFAVKYLTCIFYFFYMGFSAGYGSWVTVYALDVHVTESHSDAAYLTSIYWTAMTLGRIVAIFVAIYLSSTVMLRIKLSQCLVTAVLLVFISTISYNSLVIGSFLFGYADSSIFPLGMTVLTDYGFEMDPSGTTLFMVGTTMGEAILPAVIGYCMQYGGAFTFPYMIVGCICILIIIYFFVDLLGKRAGQSHSLLVDQSTHSTNSDKDKSRHGNGNNNNNNSGNSSPTGVGGTTFSPLNAAEDEDGSDLDDLVQIEL